MITIDKKCDPSLGGNGSHWRGNHFKSEKGYVYLDVNMISFLKCWFWCLIDYFTRQNWLLTQPSIFNYYKLTGDTHQYQSSLLVHILRVSTRYDKHHRVSWLRAIGRLLYNINLTMELMAQCLVEIIFYFLFLFLTLCYIVGIWKRQSVPIMRFF